MSERRLAVGTAGRVMVVVIAAAVTLAVSLVATGAFGLVIAADCLAALGLLGSLAGTPRGARQRPGQPNDPWDWLARVRRLVHGDQPAGVQPADFPSYAKISSDLGWAPVSRWHYDHGIRPLLCRLTASALAEHHRIDVATDPARARRMVGDDVWPLVDPARPASFDSKTPGPDLRTLARIVDRLEQL